MHLQLKEKTREALASVLPITVIVLVLSIVLVPLDVGTMMMFLAGALLLIVGMGLFQLGADMAMTPLGEGIGIQISQTRNALVVAFLGFLMGAVITISEPDLQVLAEQVPAIPNMVLILTVAVGVGIFLAVAILRIIFQISFSAILMVVYSAIIVLALLAPPDFVAVAFDAGGVTTGPMTVPFIMAMGVGIASIRSDKNAADDSFGLVALSSTGPIIAVLILGFFYDTSNVAYESAAVPVVATTQDVLWAFAAELPAYAREVLGSLMPIVVVFALFQLLCRRYRAQQIKRILVGLAYTYVGLVLFLCGVNVGFTPVGNLLGFELASLEARWLLVPIGMLIGYFIVKAEPAIQILNHQVEDVTDGAISSKTMNRCLSVGVSVSVGLAMVRVLTGIPIQWIIIPGYLVALALSRRVPKIFVGIAFDSGGVASGPMTSTFLLPLCIGACEAVGGNIMTDAFGLVALVALTPIIAVQLMGLMYQRRQDSSEALAQVADVAAEDQIMDFEEDGYDD